MAALTTEVIRDAYRKAPALSTGQIARRRATGEQAVASVGRLHAAGVPMLTGTDGGSWGVVQGYSVHRELIRLVDAGLSPWDALAASTTKAGEFGAEATPFEAATQPSAFSTPIQIPMTGEPAERILSASQRGE